VDEIKSKGKNTNNMLTNNKSVTPQKKKTNNSPGKPIQRQK